MIQRPKTARYVKIIRRQMPEALHKELKVQSSNLPVRYFRNLNPAGIREDMALTERLPAERVIVTVANLSERLMLRVLVAQDKPGIFLRVAAGLARHQIGVETASIFTGCNDGMVLDHFVLQEPVEPAVLETARREIHLSLLTGQCPIPVLQPPACHDVVVAIDNFNRADHTTVTVTGSDQPGFLFRIAQVFAAQELNLKYARIRTCEGRVVNTFHVLAKNDALLPESAHAPLRDAMRLAFSA